MKLLGLRTIDNMGATRFEPNDISVVDLDAIDAFTDTPIPSFYRQLDEHYPGSKFILTVRDEAGWLKSCKKQFNDRHAAMREQAINDIFHDLYGTNVFDQKLFSEGYRRFVDGVKAHFADRPDDLLIMDIAGGDGWETLCPFVGREVPEVPIRYRRHRNTATYPPPCACAWQRHQTQDRCSNSPTRPSGRPPRRIVCCARSTAT